MCDVAVRDHAVSFEDISVTAGTTSMRVEDDRHCPNTHIEAISECTYRMHLEACCTASKTSL